MKKGITLFTSHIYRDIKSGSESAHAHFLLAILLDLLRLTLGSTSSAPVCPLLGEHSAAFLTRLFGCGATVGGVPRPLWTGSSLCGFLAAWTVFGCVFDVSLPSFSSSLLALATLLLRGAFRSVPSSDPPVVFPSCFSCFFACRRATIPTLISAVSLMSIWL